MQVEDDFDVNSVDGGPPPSIYVVLCPEKSSFNASFGLTRRLKEHGFRIVYVGPERDRAYIEAQGFDFKSFSLFGINKLPRATLPSYLKVFDQWYVRRQQIQRNDQMWERLLYQAEELLRFEKPALILLNPLILIESLAPIKSRIPIITLNTTIASTFSLSIPPAFSDMQPGSALTLTERYRYGMAWFH